MSAWFGPRPVHVARQLEADEFCSPKKPVSPIRSVDDSPEAVYDADKDEDDKRLSNPFGQGGFCVFNLAARYGGLIGEGGAVARRSASQ
jgi:hypothetical protein